MTSQRIPLDYIKSIAIANGLEEMNDDMVNAIANDAEQALLSLFNVAARALTPRRRRSS